MKQIWTFLLLLLSLSLAARQNKNDVILKTNGDELTGKVMEITDDGVKFTYTGETLLYTIKKADIRKITFGSGRVEVFNRPDAPSASKEETAATYASTGSRNNKVAILPFSVVRDGQNTADEVGIKVQNDCYAILSRHAGELAFQDPRTTNAQLFKAGVNKDNINGYTMEDLCGILGVEYVVEGIVTLNQAAQTSTTTNTYKSSGSSDNKSDNKENKKSSGTTYATSSVNYETNVNLNIYNDKGNSVFSQTRKSFWNDQDAYKATLEYLLKRSPVYRK